ncbi:YncE family protein [Nonomuraea sp. JJY05]|uniref:YncE family protein n=1 Tax=Nonomuraea sp. JJY05 TaxID=3350255 RepID=UPI00373EDBF8
MKKLIVITAVVAAGAALVSLWTAVRGPDQRPGPMWTAVRTPDQRPGPMWSPAHGPDQRPDLMGSTVGTPDQRPGLMGSPVRSPDQRPGPASGETAAYAYLCDNAKGEGPHEECAHWFVVTSGGKTWRLTDAVERGYVDLTADGRYLAYQRAGDHRLVVRDLVGGTVRAVQEVMPGVDGDRLAYRPALLGKGRWLYVDYVPGWADVDQPASFVVDVSTGRTVWRLPKDSWLIGLDDDGSRLMFADDKSFSVMNASGTTTRPLPARLRAVEAAGILTPDGTGQAAQIVSRNFPAGGTDIRPARLVTIDTGTGKALHDIRLSLPLKDRSSICGVSRWASSREVLLTCGAGLFHDILFRVDTRTGHYAKVGETRPPRSHLFELEWAAD